MLHAQGVDGRVKVQQRQLRLESKWRPEEEEEEENRMTDEKEEDMIRSHVYAGGGREPAPGRSPKRATFQFW